MAATRDFETSVPGLKFSDVQKVKIFDMALPYRNAYYETTGMNIAVMPDNATGAVFIGITPLRGKKRRELDKINKDYNDLSLSLRPKVVSALQAQFPGQGPETVAAQECPAHSGDDGRQRPRFGVLRRRSAQAGLPHGQWSGL